MLYQVWRGTTMACDCRHVNGKYYRDTRCIRRRDDSVGQHPAQCTEQVSHPPIVMNRLNGVRVCAKRGTVGYGQVQRNLEIQIGGVCPNGYDYCGSHYNNIRPTAENTICLPVSDVKAGKCPITDLKFITKTEIQTYQNKGYQVSFVKDMVIAFSKMPNQLPI